MTNYKTKDKSYLLTGAIAFGILVTTSLTGRLIVAHSDTLSDAPQGSVEASEHTYTPAMEDMHKASQRDEMVILLQESKVQDGLLKEREEERQRQIALEKERIRQEKIKQEQIRLAKIEQERKAKEEAQRLTQIDKESKLKESQTLDKKEEVVQAKTESKSSGKSLGAFEATQYLSSCNGCSGISASGYDVRNTIYYQGMRIVAAPKSIPFYTKLRITFANGSQMNAIVLDRGGAITSGKLDILVSSREEAIRFGRQQVKVTILN